MRTRLLIGLISFGFVLEGCSTVPLLEEATGGIPVREIVLRVKCELSDAFMPLNSDEFLAKDRASWWLPEQAKFAWLQNWTAQADLILQVMDTAALAPGATFTEPLPNGWGFAAGPSSFGGKTINAIPQNFMVAAGANLGGQSQRIETMTFVFSLKELEAWRERDKARVEQYGVRSVCELSDKMDLAGRLGLREWLAEALSPVERQDGDAEELLYANYHPKPGQPAAPKPIAGTPFSLKPLTPAPAAAAPDTCTKVADMAKDTIKAVNDQMSKATEAKTLAVSTKSKFDKLLESVTASKKDLRKFGETYGEVLAPERMSDETKTLKEIENIKIFADEIKKNVETVANSTEKASGNATQARDNADSAIAEANKPDCVPYNANVYLSKANKDLDILKQYAENAKENADKAVENYKRVIGPSRDVNTSVSTLKTIDQPIASVGQNVQFIVNYGGNVTPTWNFVRFKGPNNPLFSAQGTRTHILNISLGPSAIAIPGGPTGTPGLTRAPGGAVQQSQINLLLTTLLPARPF